MLSENIKSGNQLLSNLSIDFPWPLICWTFSVPSGMDQRVLKGYFNCFSHRWSCDAICKRGHFPKKIKTIVQICALSSFFKHTKNESLFYKIFLCNIVPLPIFIWGCVAQYPYANRRYGTVFRFDHAQVFLWNLLL